MKLKALMCFVALILFVPAVLASTTWYVNGASGSDSNHCLSARAACKTIGHALSLASSGDSIVVAAGTYKENLLITFSLNIIAAGAGTTVIDGGGAGGVIFISNPKAVVSLSNMTLRNGHAASGGGISNWGALTLNHITVTRNAAPSIDAFGAFGGGILNSFSGILTISNSTISDNAAHSSVNGSLGGGIYNTGTMTISNSTISENTASGVGRDGAENHSQGGGIFNSNSGTLWVNNSTLSANVVLAGTGGLVGTGGGISNGGTLTISNTTFNANSASSGGAISNKGATALQDTIVANSTGGNCAGSIASKGYNLSSDGTCNFNAHGDLNNHDPMLGPLQNNGGPTHTMALLPGRPAIDGGNPSGCTDGQGHLLKTDQRGMPRPDREDIVGCDIGHMNVKPTSQSIRACVFGE